MEKQTFRNHASDILPHNKPVLLKDGEDHLPLTENRKEYNRRGKNMLGGLPISHITGDKTLHRLSEKLEA